MDEVEADRRLQRSEARFLDAAEIAALRVIKRALAETVKALGKVDVLVCYLPVGSQAAAGPPVSHRLRIALIGTVYGRRLKSWWLYAAKTSSSATPSSRCTSRPTP